MAKLFGTDGVRGIANRDLTPEKAFRLGRAGATVLIAETEAGARKPCLLIGRDTRVSGDMLLSALCAGILSVGASVCDLGVATTPAIAWLTRNTDVQAGVVISASHNPMQDNGIKFIAHNGYKLSDALEEKITALLNHEPAAERRPIGDDVGRIYREPELLPKYLDHLVTTVADTRLDGLRLALDCANGAVAATAALPFQRLGAEVHLLHHQPDGTNINAGCGSTHPESLQEYVREKRLDFGLAFDGDADRCLAVDAEGNLIDGDQIMAILALGLKERGELVGNTLVTTIYSNLGLHLGLRQHGIATRQTKVGDRYVLEEMLNAGFSLGGEQSGHIILSSFATTGDGLLTGLQLAARVRQTGESLQTLSQVITRLPQVLESVHLNDLEKAQKSPEFLEAQKKAAEELGERGRLLIRPSGTEPVLRIMVEAPSHEEANHIAQFLIAACRSGTQSDVP